jgi:hypothetical protein
VPLFAAGELSSAFVPSEHDERFRACDARTMDAVTADLTSPVLAR